MDVWTTHGGVMRKGCRKTVGRGSESKVVGFGALMREGESACGGVEKTDKHNEIDRKDLFHGLGGYKEA